LPSVKDVAKLIVPLFEAYHAVRLALEQSRPANCQPAIDDIRSQLLALLPDRFLIVTPWSWLVHFPRYLQAIVYRLKKLTSGGLERDLRQSTSINRRWESFQQRLGGINPADQPDVLQYRWLLEELRVSLFAQELGTSVPISPARIDRVGESLGIPF
jgi:ATP-dependent helicase HrpA